MLVVQCVSFRNVAAIPPIVTDLRATEQQDGHATRVKRVKNAVRLTLVLYAQFTHLAVLGTTDVACMRECQCRAELLEQINACDYRTLLVIIQFAELSREFVGTFDLPGHEDIIWRNVYIVKHIFAPNQPLSRLPTKSNTPRQDSHEAVAA
jgi:hypothetical protein